MRYHKHLVRSGGLTVQLVFKGYCAKNGGEGKSEIWGRLSLKKGMSFLGGSGETILWTAEPEIAINK